MTDIKTLATIAAAEQARQAAEAAAEQAHRAAETAMTGIRENLTQLAPSNRPVASFEQAGFLVVNLNTSVVFDDLLVEIAAAIVAVERALAGVREARPS